ncbi:MAG: cytochrome P450-dit2 [Caeruleum heppii]|nr:MAG: cytochrome P450-dit2 [Caeruleum heppii]
MTYFVAAVATFLMLVITACYCFLLPPKNFPRNIPTIPFYVSLLPFFFEVDQVETYKKYLKEPLEKHGAVKIFFASKWNILVERPEYVAEIFKHEDLYAKSGNQKKIPYSVIAEYTGDNIISGHGADWRKYQDVLKPGMQRNFDAEPILNNAKSFLRILRNEVHSTADHAVLLAPLLQRYTMANYSESMLTSNFGTLDRPDAPLHKLQVAVQREIVKPIFLTFPFLDKLPVPSRMAARKLGRTLQDELCRTVRNSHKNLCCTMSSDRMGSRMIAARDTNVFTEQQLRHNMVILLLAGYENPQLQIISLMYLLAKHPDAQERLRSEVSSLGSEAPTHDNLAQLPYMTSVLYESLRLFPPISQLLNRRTSAPVLLGGKIPIPAGTYLGYNGYATGHNKATWGDDADAFRPERWGTTPEEINLSYRRANSRAEFIAFHGGRRACLGQKFSMLEARVTMYEFLRQVRWELDPTWPDRMTPAGPLFPRALRLKFHDL